VEDITMEQQSKKIGTKVKCIYCHKRAVQQVVIEGEKIDLCHKHRIKKVVVPFGKKK
jgi:hypothetical protein